MSLHFGDRSIISSVVVPQASYSACDDFRWMLTRLQHRMPKVARTPPKSDNRRFCGPVTWRYLYNRGVIVCVLGGSICCVDGCQLVLSFQTKLSGFCSGNHKTHQLQWILSLIILYCTVSRHFARAGPKPLRVRPGWSPGAPNRPRRLQGHRGNVFCAFGCDSDRYPPASLDNSWYPTKSYEIYCISLALPYIEGKRRKSWKSWNLEVQNP